MLCLLCFALATPPPVRAQERSVGIYRVRLSLTPEPPVVGDAKVHLDVTRPAYTKGRLESLPQDGLVITVLPTMPDMPRMRTSTVRCQASGKGGYEAEVPLSMPGAWRLGFQIKDAQSGGEFAVALQVKDSSETETAAPVPTPSQTSVSPPTPTAFSPSPRTAQGQAPSKGDTGFPSPLPTASLTSSPTSSPTASPTAGPTQESSPNQPPKPGARPQAQPEFQSDRSQADAASSQVIQLRPGQALRVGEADIALDIKPALAEGTAVWGALTMPGMPMVLAPRPARVGSDGLYHLPVRLPMAGLYSLTVDLRRATTTLQRKTFQVHVTAAISAWERFGPQGVMIVLLLLVGCGGGLALLGPAPRGSLRTTVGCILCLGVPLVIGTQLPHPPDTQMGMVMDMAAPDMGMSFPDLAAPLPVVLQTLSERVFVPLVTTSGRIVPHEEVLVSAGHSGLVSGWKVQEGEVVKAGQALATLGAVELRAPHKGVITARLVDLGSAVQSATPIVRLGRVDALDFEGKVSLADAAWLAPGQEGSLTTFENRSCPIQLKGLTQTVDAASQTVRVWGTVSDGACPLRPGQQVSLRFSLGARQRALVIPLEAMFESAGRAAVWRVDDVAGQGVAHRAFVRIEARSDKEASISGLVAGERVVANHPELLEDGELVTAGKPGEGAYQNLALPAGP